MGEAVWETFIWYGTWIQNFKRILKIQQSENKYPILKWAKDLNKRQRWYIVLNKYMKRFWAPYIIKELQMKTIMISHTPIRVTKVKEMTIRIWCKDENSRTAHSLLVEMHNHTATLEDRLAVSYNAKQSLTIRPIQHAPRLKIHLYTKSCTRMFIATLFIITRSW